VTENHFDEIDVSDAAVDPEADAIVDDALDIDSVDEAIAADEATHDEAEVTAEHDGGADAPAEPEEDPYADFKKELRRKPGNWYVVHSYAG
jgi:transcriptional antiterminator NusG